METLLIRDNMDKAAEIIKNGGLVAVPTETVYGLAGNGLDGKAVGNIYEVKGRPAIKPLSLMVPGSEAMERYCTDVPEQAYALAEKFWPGPLTIVLKSKDSIPPIVLAGGKTVGLRCPDHPLTLELLKKCALPLAAPSANPSGAESPKTAGRVMEYFSGSIEAVIDGGECGIGLESTILDMTQTPYRILRQGALPAAEIEKALAEKIRIIGITGGTGCGKTTALNELKALGALILDCDAVYHELLRDNVELNAELAARFPDAVTNSVLDRKALGAIVFRDEQALGDLNRITHRYVEREIWRRLGEFAMNGGTLAAIDAIELFSSGLDKCCFTTLAVLADREKRIERIMARDGISRGYAEMRVDAQRPNAYFEQCCEHVLYNNAGAEQFAQDCRRLYKEILSNG